MIEIAASLSSRRVMFTGRPAIKSKRSRAGIAIALIPREAEASSDSGVDQDANFSVLERHDTWKSLNLPWIERRLPDVERELGRSPARSASA